MTFSFSIKDAPDRLYWLRILFFSAKSKDLEMSPTFLRMESYCELVYILLFQLLQFMEIKIWFKFLSTKTVEPESCWERTGGSMGKGELISLIFLTSVWLVLHFVPKVMFWSPEDLHWIFFLVMSLPIWVSLPVSFRAEGTRGVIYTDRIPG